jgi:hypothetical protein
MLYRIPRSQMTTGIRALGRLAWCDNYRAIVHRLRAELEALLDPEPLAAADRQTKLGLRTNRPRVDVVTGLAGGTGGGMFLDLAYTVRALLAQTGCERPDVAGLLLLPAVDKNRTRALALGNAYAAPTELNHFARPDTWFRAQYVENESLEDSAPPFGRCVVLSLPEETDEAGVRQVVARAGQYLSRDMCSPLGRAADLARAGLSCPSWELRGLYGQTFGLFRLSWPRRALFATVGRRLCQQLIARWMSKDSKPVRAAVQARVQEQWAQQELGADVFLDRLAQACCKKLGQPPESAFKAILQPLLDTYGPGAGSDAGTQARSASEGTLTPRPPSRAAGATTEIPAGEVAAVLERFEELLGDPTDETLPDPGPRLLEVLREATDQLVQEWAQKLSEMSVHLIEEPDFRLAGAEEAVRQAVATIEQILHHHEPLSKDLTAKARGAFHRLRFLTVPPQARPGGAKAARRAQAADVLELMRSYAKWHYQSLVLHQLGSAPGSSHFTPPAAR